MLDIEKEDLEDEIFNWFVATFPTVVDTMGGNEIQVQIKDFLKNLYERHETDPFGLMDPDSVH